MNEDPQTPASRRYGISMHLALISVVVLLWFSPWWIAGKVIAPLDLLNRMMSPWKQSNESVFAKNHIVSDAVDQYLVYRMIAAESYKNEGWLGWSTLTYGGTAQHANTMALYYDWTMQLHRWFDFWTAWHIGFLGQVLLAAWGMYLFLRGRAVGGLWACCGALAYAANSQFVTWIYHRWTLGAFCWVPWILWAIDRHRKGSRFSWPLVPIFTAMAFLGGTLQHAALVSLTVAAAWIEDIFRTRRAVGPQAKLFGQYLLWGVLGTGIAAAMFLPCVDAFIASNRLGLHTGMTSNVEHSIYPQGPLQPLFNLAAYPLQAFPSLLGRCDSVDVLKLFKSELFYIAFFGAIPVCLGFRSLWAKDSPQLARLLVGAGLLLPLTPLVRFLYQRLFLLFIVGGILAFTHFMRQSARETRIRVFHVLSYSFAFAAICWLATSVFLKFQPTLIEAIRTRILQQGSGSSFGYFNEWIRLRADQFVADLFIWSPHQLIPLILFTMGLAGFRMTASLRKSARNSGRMVLAIAILAETTLFASKWVIWCDPENTPLFPETAETRALAEHVGRDGRVTTLIHPTAHMARTPFVPNTLAAYNIAIIGGYDSIIPDGMILPNEDPGNPERLGRLGVSHLVTWHGNPEVPDGWIPVWSSPSMDLYQNRFAIPRYAGCASEVEMRSLFHKGIPRFTLLRESGGLQNHRLIDVPPGIRWVRIAENHAAGWQFRTRSDGGWQKVDKAPDGSMLIENPNPKTSTKLEMRYSPSPRKWGLVISGTSLILTFLAAYFIPRKPALQLTPA